MEREILFRGKQLSNGEFIEGSLTVDCHGNCCIYHPLKVPIGGGFQYFDIDPETVGQFTGMTDKNGTKIFEGDIYNMGDDNIRYVVVWRKCMFIGKQIGSNSYAGLDYFESDIKKVGNIYDNKELLK